MGSHEGLLSQIHLLPGIPNEITLDHIAPKLPWRAFHILSSVSRTWQHAIQSHHVYDARVRSQSTDKVILVNCYVEDEERVDCTDFDPQRILLYSLREKRCFQLPPIPNVRRGIPWLSNCISLNGKIYILGGLELSALPNAPSCHNSGKVYMLDVAGQGEWKQCASMQEPRQCFGCGVMDGKIYIFGGCASGKNNTGLEVYDTKLDAWSSIMPMRKGRKMHDVTTVGEKLFVHGGTNCFDESMDMTNEENQEDCKRMDFFLGVYHPDRNDWREVRPAVGRQRLKRVFMAQGTFHSMTNKGIYVHDTDENVWSLKHTFPSAAIAPLDSHLVEQPSVLVVGEELWAKVSWGSRDEKTYETDLLQSRGFGSKNEEILWEKANLSLPSRAVTFDVKSFMCPMQL